MKVFPIFRSFEAGARLSTGRARWAVLALGLAAGLQVAAQQSGPPEDAMPADAPEGLGNPAQAADSGQAEEALREDIMTSDGLPETNTPGLAGTRTNQLNRFLHPTVSTNDDRRFSGRRSFRSRSYRPSPSSSFSGRSGGGQVEATNSTPASLDYAGFKVIVDRNIFDPNRVPHLAAGSVRKPRTVDSLTLVGTMSYEKGTFAFFDGSSSEYRKALRMADTIAGYKLTNIAASAVKLASGTNMVELPVGAQLRREEDGPWQVSSPPATYADSAPSAPASGSATAASSGSLPAAPSGPDSDVLKKLMERRAKE
jgi:hypothetical protein